MDFSNALIPAVTLLSNPTDSFSVRYYGYLTKDVEFLFMAALLSFIFCLQNFFLGRDARIPIILLMIVLIIAHFAVVYYAATWIPTLQALATLAVALYFTRRKTNQYRRGRFQLPW
jgi:general stress protein CsbA